MLTKIKCRGCNKLKLPSSFYKRGSGRLRIKCKKCYNSYLTEYRSNNKDVIKKRQQRWAKENSKIVKIKRAARYVKNKRKVLRYCKEYYIKNRSAVRARYQRYKWKLKLQVINAYGGKCSCCPENEPKFLTIEHINKDGKAHRAAVGNVYIDIRNRGFPPEYTIHCFNCNIAKSLFGVCPHQLKYKPVGERRV